ncbi:MAG: type II methionyl aminopeptidase [Candidatus Micrarchaeaceae archaeon]
MGDIKILKEAGKISVEALEYSKTIIKEGVSILEAAEKIENFIIDKGYQLSFPINLSINEKAAHYTPFLDNKYTFQKNDLVKVDLGARKEDNLSDCAITIDLSGENQKMVEAAEMALEEAISLVKSGRKVREIGAAIENLASKYNFNPIFNLGGHGIESEELHAGTFIPNFDNGDETELNEGDIISIEPFITNGAGYVSDSDEVQIFQLIPYQVPTPRSQDTRKVLKLIQEKYLTYPFSLRWIARELNELSEFRIRKSISELDQLGLLEKFPVLIEKKNGLVTQAEKELIVEKDSCTILTKI